MGVRKICATCRNWADSPVDCFDYKEFGRCYERASPFNCRDRRWNEGCDEWKAYEDPHNKCNQCGVMFISGMQEMRFSESITLCRKCVDKMLEDE